MCVCASVCLGVCVCVRACVDVCVSFFVCMWVQMSASIHKGQKSALDPLEVEFQVLGSHMMWMLGNKLLSFGTTRAPNHQATIRDPQICFEIFQPSILIWKELKV